MWAKKSREQTSTKVSVESDPLWVPCNLPPSAQFPSGLQSPFSSSVPVNRSFTELAQAFSSRQLAFRQEFASELLQLLFFSSKSSTLPFSDFSVLLEEIARGSFCGLIAIPPASTWSRARNSGNRGPPPLRSRDSPLGIQGLSPRLLGQVREHNGALECCVMALEVWCRSFPLRPFFFVAPEDRGGQVHKRSSIDLAA